jgi:hypothetical protein
VALIRTQRTRQQQGNAQINRGLPLAQGLVWFTADPAMLSRAGRPSPVGMTFAPAEAQVTGPAVSLGQYSDVTLLSFGVLNGTANSGNQQGGIRLVSTSARIHEFTGNANASANVQYSDFTNTTIASTAHGINVNGGVLALGLRHIRGATNGVALFVNGRVLASANAQNKALVTGAGNITAHWAQAAGNQGYLTAFNAFWSRALTDAEMLSVSLNPWQLFTQDRPAWTAEAASVTVYRPGSDITVNGWTPSTGSDLFAMLDETTLDRGDYITSPNLTNSTTLGWQSPMAAGTYDISVDFDRTGSTGELRMVLLDSGGSQVGVTAWQTAPASAATHTFTGVTTSGTSDRFRIEVR